MEKKLIFGFLTLILGIMTFAQLSLLQAKAETPLSYPITYFEDSSDTSESDESNTTDTNNTNNNNNSNTNENVNEVTVTVTNTNTSEQKLDSTPYVCTDSKPGSAPVLVSATQTGSNQISLFWNKANDPVTHYAVVYGTEPGKPTFGVANTGSNETSYTINNLIGGQTYYFRVYGIHGCMPGDFSNELSQKALGQSENINNQDTVLGDYDSHVQPESDEDTADYPEVGLIEEDNSWSWLWNNRIFGSIGSFFSNIFNFLTGK